MSAILAGKLVGSAISDSERAEDDDRGTRLPNGIATGCIMGSAAITSYMATNILKKIIRSI
jgi:hypothetical protein